MKIARTNVLTCFALVSMCAPCYGAAFYSRVQCADSLTPHDGGQVNSPMPTMIGCSGKVADMTSNGSDFATTFAALLTVGGISSAEATGRGASMPGSDTDSLLVDTLILPP